MPSDETRRVLDEFSAAVTALEESIDRKAPFDQIMAWDRAVADRTREVIAFGAPRPCGSTSRG